MPFPTNIANLATRIATEFRSIRTLITGSSTGDLSGLTTTAKTNLVSAINEVKAGATGGATTLDGLTDVTVSSPAVGHILRHDGAGQFTNVLGTDYFQATDADLTAIAALTTTAYGRGLLTLADQGALLTAVGTASTGAKGVIQLATQAEADTGTDAVKAITSSVLAGRLGNYQPLDADLTAIAALATTAYGRGLLTLANQAALAAAVGQGTTAAQGVLQLATNAEAVTGTDTAKVTTPAGVSAVFSDRIVTATDLGGGSASNTKVPSQAAVKAYADGLLDANNAMQFKGAIDASTNPNYPAANAGWTYRISVAGKIGGASGPNVEVGDTLVCLTDGSAAGNHATVGVNWLILQTNLDGAVLGPASSVSGNLASFNGTTGKQIQDSGYGVDNDTALAANSANRVPTQAAVKGYAQPLDSELTAIAGLTSAADRLPYFTGSNTASLATFTSFGRSLMDDADAATARTTLGLGSAATQNSSAFQAADTELSAIAALVSATDTAPYFNGAGSAALFTLTSFGRTLAASADNAAARSSLDVYSKAEVGDPETNYVTGFNTALNA